MSSVFITQPGCVLKIEGGRLVVKTEDGAKHVILLHRIHEVVVSGHAVLTTGVIGALGKAGVDLIFLGYDGRFVGRMERPLAKNLFLRKAQYRLSDDDSWSLEIARQIVGRKCGHMLVFAQRLAREKAVEGSSERIAKFKGALRGVGSAHSIGSLRGLEGFCTRLYYAILAGGIDKTEWRFTDRSRRPPRDPANALLSYGYAVLANIVESEVLSAGLDPYCGTLHAETYGRPSLALDLMEEFRPVVVDPCVLKVLNLKMLSTAHFREHIEPDENVECDAAERTAGVWLTPEGVRIYLGVIQKRLREEMEHAEMRRRMTLREIIREHVRAYRSIVDGVRNSLPELGWR